MENIIIAQSSTVYDNMCKQIEDQTAQLKRINKEIDRLISVNLKVSLLYEGSKTEIRELKEATYKQQNIIGILAHFANEHCEMFEQIFESDEQGFHYEDMQKYLDIAEYMDKAYGRKTNYIRRVKERMNSLKF